MEGGRRAGRHAGKEACMHACMHACRQVGRWGDGRSPTSDGGDKQTEAAYIHRRRWMMDAYGVVVVRTVVSPSPHPPPRAASFPPTPPFAHRETARDSRVAAELKVCRDRTNPGPHALQDVGLVAQRKRLCIGPPQSLVQLQPKRYRVE
eukprot:GHVU01031237.1.p1 GENE.GHVU01031237.1~~GHVU01031237.1.p1  ORF type:complete len:149 (+),score=0.78 GHVU01031237.1:286-732(+)